MASESNSRVGDDQGGAKGGRTTSALKRQIARIEDDAEDAWSRTRDVFSDVTDTLDIKGRLNRNPYGTLAAVVGIGYVLGGGFFTPLTARLVRLGLKMGVRLAILPLLNDEAANLVSEMVGAEGSSGSESKSRKGRQNNSNEGKVT
jgi:hypothetical protein